jgi:hypothetical protein
MMRYLLAATMVLILSGCTWEDVENNANSTQAGASKVEIVGVALSPYTNGYGGLVAAIAGGVSGIAGAVSAFAANKKRQKIARAAVEAADALPAGGRTLVDAALVHGVADELNAIYRAQK